jgi:fermentation-respiration switch protein FrsA (DUF1100 family)
MTIFKKSLFMDLLVVILVPVVFMTLFGVLSVIRPRKMESSVNPSHFNMKYENIVLTTEDDLSLAAWYVPRNGNPVDSAIVVLHSYSTEKGDMLARTSYLNSDYNLLYVDFRYFGKSEGQYTTLGIKEMNDLTAAVRYLEGKGMRHIGVYGMSMGGAVGLMGIAEPSLPIDAVVAEASYADLKAAAHDIYRYLGPLEIPLTIMSDLVAGMSVGVNLEQVSPERAVKGVRKPILIVHSKQDKIIDFVSAERLKEASSDNPNAEFLFFETGDHGQASTELAQVVFKFFREGFVRSNEVDAGQPGGI